MTEADDYAEPDAAAWEGWNWNLAELFLVSFVAAGAVGAAVFVAAGAIVAGCNPGMAAVGVVTWIAMMSLPVVGQVDTFLKVRGWRRALAAQLITNAGRPPA